MAKCIDTIRRLLKIHDVSYEVQEYNSGIAVRIKYRNSM